MDTDLKNIFIRVEYDGSLFSGWQRQAPGKPTIQAEIEDILSKFLDRKVVLYGASRTDAGVHARGQAANFYVPPRLEAGRWAYFLNWSLPKSIRILSSQEAPPKFHAQKMAVSKIYEYRLLQRNCASAIDPHSAYWPKPLNWEAIREAMPHFVGTHDFKAFQTAGTPLKTTIRTVSRFELVEDGFGRYRFVIEGNGFLKQMVRNIIGTLIEIGEGKRKPGSIPGILASLDRTQAGHAAHASGLCLVKVNYREGCGIV